MAGTSNTLWVGDKWQIGAQFNKRDNTPYLFSNDATPAGKLYVGKSTAPAIDMTIQNGRLIVLDQNEFPGAVVYQLLPEELDVTVNNPLLASAFNRIQTELLDIDGEPTTQGVYGLDVRSPQTGSLTGLSQSTIIITVEGQLGGGGGEGGTTVLRRNVTSVSSYAFAHSFDFSPRVWAVLPDNSPIEVDYTYGSSVVNFVFSQPFTGTLYLG